MEIASLAFVYIIGKAIINKVAQATILDEGETIPTFLVKYASEKVFDSQAESFWAFSKKKFKDWRSVLSAPENTELMLAARRSWIHATLVLCNSRLQEISQIDKEDRKAADSEKTYLEQVRKELNQELRQIQKPGAAVTSSLLTGSIEELIKSKFDAAGEAEEDFRTGIKAALITELESIQSRMQGEAIGLSSRAIYPRIREMIEEGWGDPKAAKKTDWLDLVSRLFLEEIQNNHALKNILETSFLIQIKARQAEQTLDLKSALEEYRLDLAGRIDHLGDRMASKVDELLREIRRRPLYEKLAGQELARRVDQIKDRFKNLYGREDDLQKLDDFIHENTTGIMTISAPAGYGKSALLANWIDRRRDAGDFVAYHFFSTRDDLAKQTFSCLYHLLNQLYIYYEIDDATLPTDETVLKLTLANLIRTNGTSGHERLIIVIDGLDEADKDFAPLITSGLEEHVHIAASWRAGQEASSTEIIRWSEISRQHHEIRLLDLNGVKQWISKVNDGKLSRLADNNETVRKIYDKTQGLALYLSYLIDDLIAAVDSGKDVERILENTPEGFSAYALEQLRQMQPDNEKIEKLFAILCVALGAISQKELQILTGLSPFSFAGMSLKITRWFNISRQAQGSMYSFAHPLLANEFRSILNENCNGVLIDLIRYCSDWKSNCSLYSLRYYPHHLLTGKDWEKLYNIARNEEFLIRQSEKYPDFPSLQLETIQCAICGAAEQDDPVLMAEFFLRHVKRAAGLKSESPYLVAKRGNIGRAIELADQHDSAERSYWYLLIIWYLCENGLIEDVIQSLKKLNSRNLPHMDGWMTEASTYFVYQIISKTKFVLHFRLQSIFDDDSILGLINRLIKNKNLVKAQLAAREIRSPKKACSAKCEIAKAHAKAEEVGAAKSILIAAMETAAAIEDAKSKAYALSEIAEALSKTGEKEAAMSTIEAAKEMAVAIRDVRIKPYVLVAIAKALAEAGEIDAAKSTLEAAKETAVAIRDARIKPYVLVAIAKALAEAGEIDAAKSTFDAAKETALAIEYAWVRGEALSAIATALAEDGEIDAAKEMARVIDHTGMRYAALSEIAKAQAEAGDINAAKETAAAIQFASSRDDALSEIAKAQAEAGDINAAKETAAAIEPDRTKPYALIAIAIAQAEVGEIDAAMSTFDAAKETAAAIQFASSRDDALSEVATAQAEAGDINAAKETAAAIEDDESKANALSEIAKAQAEAGDINAAKETVAAIQYAGSRDDALITIAKAQAEEGEIDAAKETAVVIEDAESKAKALLAIARALAETGWIDAAKEMAGAIDDAKSKAEALSAIATALAEDGEIDAAKETAAAIEDDESKAGALMGIATVLAETEEMDAAMNTFDAAKETAVAIDDAWGKTYALNEIAVTLTKIGKIDAAKETAEMLEDTWSKAFVLSEIAIAQAEVGEIDAAKETAEVIEDTVSKTYALRAIAAAQSKAGEIGAAKETAAAIEDDESKAGALMGIATVLAETEEMDAAMNTFDAAKETASAIEDAESKASTLWWIARSQADANLFLEAISTVEMIPTSRQDHLPGLAAIIAQKNKSFFKKLLVPCAYYLASTNKICGILARTYSHKANEITRIVKEVN